MSFMRLTVLAAALVLSSTLIISASGRMALYGLLDKVVFEPSEQAPERIQVWGAFAYGDLTPATGAVQGQPSSARRGYLYFTAPQDPASKRATLAEWRDLKAVAGTGQAVAFGLWGYVSYFSDLDPSKTSPEVLIRSVVGGRPASQGPGVDLHIRASTEAVEGAAVYVPNTGVVKLPEQGSRADVVKVLKAAPAAPAATAAPAARGR